MSLKMELMVLGWCSSTITTFFLSSRWSSNQRDDIENATHDQINHLITCGSLSLSQSTSEGIKIIK